jgi:hypothetical protein
MAEILRLHPEDAIAYVQWRFAGHGEPVPEDQITREFNKDGLVPNSAPLDTSYDPSSPYRRIRRKGSPYTKSKEQQQKEAKKRAEKEEKKREKKKRKREKKEELPEPLLVSFYMFPEARLAPDFLSPSPTLTR